VLTPTLHGIKLVAEATLDTPVENALVPHTLEPVAPRAVRGAPVDRLLGLAVAVYPWMPPAGT
jgi:hypothetical protein